jgi:hypothetical protein
MVDCSTGAPLPDLYTGIVWAKTMGPAVLATTVTSANSTAIRAYAHCSADGKGGVTVLLINLSANDTTVSFGSALGAAPRSEYVLTPSSSAGLTKDRGLLGTGIELNGKLLEVPAAGGLPQIAPREVAAGGLVSVPAMSIAFHVLPASAATKVVCA